MEQKFYAFILGGCLDSLECNDGLKQWIEWCGGLKQCISLSHLVIFPLQRPPPLKDHIKFYAYKYKEILACLHKEKLGTLSLITDQSKSRRLPTLCYTIILYLIL